MQNEERTGRLVLDAILAALIWIRMIRNHVDDEGSECTGGDSCFEGRHHGTMRDSSRSGMRRARIHGDHASLYSVLVSIIRGAVISCILVGIDIDDIDYSRI
jgi:hypothetical protein